MSAPCAVRRKPARRAALKSELGVAYASTADERGLAWLREALDELDPAT